MTAGTVGAAAPPRVAPVGMSAELAATLDLVADTIVESLGFEVVAINLIDADDDAMVVAAVRGPQEVRELLLHRRQSRAGWQQLLEESTAWGRLRFLDHATCTQDPDDMFTWRPDLPVVDDPDAWHPDDALFALLVGADGAHLGMLSVDVPTDGRRPGPVTRRALEAFAVTASLAIQQAQLAAERAALLGRFQAVFASSPVPIALLSDDRRFLEVNPAYCRFLGRSAQEMVGHDPVEFTHPDDRGLGWRAAPGGLPDGARPGAARSAPIEKRYLLPDGTVVWGRLHLTPLDDAVDRGTVMAQVEDITERKRAEALLVQQAHYDALTGLPNRTESMRRLRAALEPGAAPVAVFFCDLDRLKLVNDAHGHAVGDAYLREVSRRLEAGVRDGDVVGRLSGDEFVVVVRGVGSETEAVALAERLVAEVRRPLRLGGVDFTPSLSLGIAFSSAEVPVGADQLLAHADAAMYHAKVEERGSWHVYQGALRSSPAEQLQLRSDVARALQDDELELHYQPVVRLRDARVVGHEALLRWRHPQRGLLLPAQFLDVIVDSEYETPVTDWVVARACRDAARRPRGQRKVSVNVSSVQIARRDLPGRVAAGLAVAGLDPEDLVLELTEDRLLDRTDGDELLQRLRAVGVTLAVDDFGTGYAGLGYLERLSSVGVLKLDRSFTAALTVNPVAQHVVRSTASLARDCGLLLISEGVETAEQAELLRGCGVELAQGFFFGRPAPFADLVGGVAADR